MELQTKLIRSQISLLKPFVVGSSLETARSGQDRLGLLMATLYRNKVTHSDIPLGDASAALILPKDRILDGIILYLHGGGYTCGDLEYSKGFGTILAAKCGIPVFCLAYRLAPEAVFPAAVDDALAAYEHLLSLGYQANRILLCGESAGGGLIFSLCLKLKSLGYTLPAGMVAICPWTDLTMSGESFVTNKDIDPSMTRERLKAFADAYIHGNINGIDDEETDRRLKTDPLVSPLFGNLEGMPPSLIFVGGDEVMLDDSRAMNRKLLDAGCRSELVVKPDMWHVYMLYCLKENEGDFTTISEFIESVGIGRKKLHWMRLDNAAKIFPAAKTRAWSNFFRISATLDEEIDREVLKTALDVTLRRFPSIAVRLRRGLFWYYLEEIPKLPKIQDEKCQPLFRAPFDDTRKCAFRVLVYKNRIAAEFFHAVTDGTGGLIFVKTLVAEYLSEKHGVTIPAENGVLNRLEQPCREELEDSFLKYSGPVKASRREATAYMIKGTLTAEGFCFNTTLMLELSEVAAIARSYNATVTVFLTAVLIKAIIGMQEEAVPNPKRRRPVKILIPVNLRKLFPSKTLRNFALYTSPGVNVRLGEYSLEEICRIVQHHMGTEITTQQMSAKISKNVGSEKNRFLKILPLFIKNLGMKLVFNAVGERKSCLTLSNLGKVELPYEMRKHVKRMDFVLGVQAHAPYNCGVLSYGDTLYMNFIRNIEESELEYRVYRILREEGIKVKAESNQP